jgi:hypothetical protein
MRNPETGTETGTGTGTGTETETETPKFLFPFLLLFPFLFPFLFLGCQTTTTRPGFNPLPGAPTAEVRLLQARATQILADALRADSIPLRRVEERDGIIESDWFEVPGYQVTRERPLGPGIVMVRGWIDVGKAGHSVYVIETVYRVYADPSRPARELEEPVALNHPARVKVAKVLEELVKQYGEPPPPPPPPVAPPDTAPRADTVRTPVRDTTMPLDR